jgi:hypothetical protein
MVCFRLRFDRALEKVREYGFNADELKGLPDLHFVAWNLDSGGDLRGKIQL